MLLSKRSTNQSYGHVPDARPVPPRALDEAVIKRQRHDIEAEVGRALHVGVAAENVGAGAGRADIAGGQQRDTERAHVGGADGVLGRAHAPDQRRRLLGREHLGDLFELRTGHAADLLDHVRRIFLDLLADVVHAVDALFDELLVLPAVLEDVPEHAVDHGNIGAGADAHVFGGVRRRTRHARIDHDHVGALHLLAFQHVLQGYRMRLGGIAAHDDDGLGVADVRVTVGHRAVAPGVGYAGDRGRVTDTRLVVGVVGAPERREFAVEVGALIGELGRAQPVDGVGAVLGADRHQLVADLVDGDVPGDAGPLPVHQLHRIAQAAVTVHELAGGRTLGAMRAAVDRRIPAGFLANPHAVDDFTDHGAADRTMRADVLLHDGACHQRTGGGGFGLAHAAERQSAQRCKAAAGKAGAAQEGTAIEPRGLSGQLLGDGAAGNGFGTRAVCFLDQHGGLPQRG